ncbi:MAG: transglutaminase-like domain-containing protein [Candidatus ainarchaeum sp.]|nr:transglutaminase-like domain-containing protein [Candidatus ainarchaeum sp.]
MNKSYFLLFLLLIPLVSAYYPYNYGEVTVKYSFDYSLSLGQDLDSKEWLELKLLRPMSFETVKESILADSKTITPKSEVDKYGNGWITYKLEHISQDVKFPLEYVIKSPQPTDLKYLQYSDSNYLVISPEIQKLANDLYDKDLIKFLINVTSWINKNLEYDYSKLSDLYYNVDTSADTLTKKKGVCVDFSILESAILKSKGYETRLVVGYVFDGKSWGSHAWLDVYDVNYGWIGADPTYNQVYYLDATHIKSATFSDYDEMHDSILANVSLDGFILSKPNALDLNINIISTKGIIQNYDFNYPQKLKSGEKFNFCIDSNFLVLPIAFFSSLEPKEFTGNLYGNYCLDLKAPDINGIAYVPYILYLPGEKIDGNFEVVSEKIAQTKPLTTSQPESIDNNQTQDGNDKQAQEEDEDYTNIVIFAAVLGGVIILLALAKRYFFK